MKAFLSNILMDKYLVFVVKNDRVDMKASRKKMNQKWHRVHFLWDETSRNAHLQEWDTILGLTSGKKIGNKEEWRKYTSVSLDDDYGVSGLGGACGYVQR